jgi:hypothetical protein
MRRAAWICLVLSVLMVVGGIAMEAARFHPGDQNAFFGDPRLILSDGQVLLVLSGFFILATAVMWVQVTRRPPASGQRRPGPGSGGSKPES